MLLYSLRGSLAIVVDDTARYRMPRTASFRSTNPLPLQIYRGSSVPPRPKPPLQSLEELAESEHLSRSSRSMLDGLSSMKPEQRARLHNKLAAEARAMEPIDDEYLHILYLDADICVIGKPSGVLSVPGPRRNPSMADLVHAKVQPPVHVDQMVVHRLDMDTSGVVVYALSATALSRLHDDFRERRVHKTYQALLEGWLASSDLELDVALERDPTRPPFMRVARPRHDDDVRYIHAGFQKVLDREPKPSLTDVHVQSWEHLDGRPVTRVSMVPHTGRTHQLRVHAAAIGHAMVGDDIYGQQSAHPLCLHAQQLCLFHPTTGAPLVFECPPNF